MLYFTMLIGCLAQQQKTSSDVEIRSGVVSELLLAFC
jgi:hypothetical protein